MRAHDWKYRCTSRIAAAPKPADVPPDDGVFLLFYQFASSRVQLLATFAIARAPLHSSHTRDSPSILFLETLSPVVSLATIWPHGLSRTTHPLNNGRARYST